MLFNLTTLCKDIFNYKKTIWLMSLKDRSNRVINAYFGILWSILQPIITIIILWLVFWFGFGIDDKVDGVPFVMWLTVGIIPWSFITDALYNGAEAITSYDYLVKKIMFKIELLPIIKILSSLFIHSVFLLLLFILGCIYADSSIYYLIQVFYYLFCAVILVLGLTLITSSINVFVRDVSKLLNILIQIGFWLTPVFWNAALMPQKYKWIIKLNPIFYIINGYRDSIIHQIGFWQRPFWTLGFWVATLLILWFGLLIFTKTRPYFADAL